jgi:hypothetical protein
MVHVEKHFRMVPKKGYWANVISFKIPGVFNGSGIVLRKNHFFTLQALRAKVMRLTRTTPFKRLLLTLPVVVFVDFLLVIISLFKGRPTLEQLLTINLWIALVLMLRFFLSLGWRLRCPQCGKRSGKDAGNESLGYPMVKCSKCGSEWLL